MLKKIRAAYMEQLKDLYEREEAQAIFYRLLEHVSGKSKMTWKLDENNRIAEEYTHYLSEALVELKQGKPLQYIMGSTTFMDLEFQVNESTLIPRPETEELVDLILQHHPSFITALSVIDIGTGSGCIPISLKHKRPHWDVTAMEISEDALNIAKENAEKNQASITWVVDDILGPQASYVKYDVLVSNPPYIVENEKSKMHVNVLHYEPQGALFVPNEKPLLFYEQILIWAKRHLKKSGEIYFEINPLFMDEMKKLLERYDNYRFSFIKDLSGKHRFMYIKV